MSGRNALQTDDRVFAQSAIVRRVSVLQVREARQSFQITVIKKTSIAKTWNGLKNANGRRDRIFSVYGIQNI